MAITVFSLFSAIGILNTAFYFSAISTQEKKKEESRDSDVEDNEPSPVSSTFSEQLLNGNPTRVNKSLWPAITYWLALTLPNGAPANPLMVHQAKSGITNV